MEQAVNAAIDVRLGSMHFPPRKLRLDGNALGVVFFPGGFGTLDEFRRRIHPEELEPVRTCDAPHKAAECCSG